MATSTTCPSCSKKYAGFGGEEARKPVVLTCLCVFCKGCALQEEAKVQQLQQRASGGVGGRKGKQKKKGEEKEEYTPTPCMSCSKRCKIPVSKLKLDVVAMKKNDSGQHAPAVPACDHCEEEAATTYCGDCLKNTFSCDACYTFHHKSVTKKAHEPMSIKEHLSAAPALSAGGAAPKMCGTHIGHPLLLFCETCNLLICAMCAAFDHAGHVYKEVQEAADAHRAMIEAAVAAVKITRQEAIAATNAIKIIRGELEGNRDAAIKLIEEGFNKLLRAIKQRRDALKKMVNDAYNEKDGVLNTQITELEEIDAHSEIALKLVEDTLAAASLVELLERKQMFVDGLMQFKEHSVSLKEECGSAISTTVDTPFEQQATDIFAVGWINTEDTDPSTSTAAGDGLTVARVGAEARFVVTAVDVATGKQRSTGGDVVAASLVQDVAVDDGAEPSGGGGGAAATKPESGKRKRGGGGSTGKGRASKKSKIGASTSTAVPTKTEATVVDNGDGTYSCSCTPPERADEVNAGKWQLEVLLNGKHIVGSPFAIEVRPYACITNWKFDSIAPPRYTLADFQADLDGEPKFNVSGMNFKDARGSLYGKKHRAAYTLARKKHVDDSSTFEFEWPDNTVSRVCYDESRKQYCTTRLAPAPH